MTYHGRVDISTAQGNSTQGEINSYNEIYTSIIQFMTGSTAASLGIQTVELNRGIGGRGLDYWDTGGNSGRATWAVFRFLSASFGQFDMAIYCSSGNILQDTFQPGVAGGSGLNGQIGVAFAVHPSGTTSLPWNGSSGSFVSGTAGTPIWKQTNDGRLAVFPRTNTSDGANASKRNAMMDLLGVDNALIRCHMIVSQDSWTFAFSNGETQNYKILHFGSYTPRSGTSIDAPYFAFQTAGVGSPAQLYTNVYGTTTANGPNSRDGGVAHPSLTSGTRTLSLMTVGNASVDSSIGSFNSFINTYDFLPIYVCIKDVNDHAILGIANNIGLGFGMLTHAVSPNSTSVALGQNTAQTLKVIAAWNGIPPGQGQTRAGREW